MTTVFVDTSALYAALDAGDVHHAVARRTWEALLDELADGRAVAVTHSGVVVEAIALVQHRLGLPAVRALADDLLPVVDVVGFDEVLYERAVAALLAAGRRDVSLVDWLSFELMRRDPIDAAFAFDDDFWQQGFERWGET